MQSSCQICGKWLARTHQYSLHALINDCQSGQNFGYQIVKYLKTPDFEITQVALDINGLILHSMDSFSSWIGETSENLVGANFYDLITDLDPMWKQVLCKSFHLKSFEKFLPIPSKEGESSLGLALAYCKYETMGVLSLSPALAPHESLKKAFLGDLMKDPRALANTLIRLQKAESRLSDYISNFPGIFFTQRPDLTFSYLSKGVQKLFPFDYKEMSRNSGLFLEKITEQDREYFQRELRSHENIKETFSLTYRVRIPPTDKIVYLLDIRTPIITATNKILGFDGVFIDITRQAIAEHRLTNSVWREGLTTLTNGLVHDFSNLMAGIFSISELYYTMMRKDDPMANGMGQIKKSALQAQKLVRRIIDLHRDKPAVRSQHNLATLLGDQMDLVGILLPPSSKVVTEFTKEPIHAYIEETGFRQVILNLVINARDVIEKKGRIKIKLKKLQPGDLLTPDHLGQRIKVPKEGAEIIISDNGSGISADIYDKIFDPFFTTKSSHSGSGFGLYNCKLFVEDHKGRIGFNSKIGKGTTFYFYLPTDLREKER